MSKYLKLFFLALAICINAAWAGDFEDGVAAHQKKDFTTALRKYKSAAAKGDEWAQYNLGVMYEQGEGAVQDYAESVRWHKLAAAQGNEWAQFNLGVSYEQGEGVVQDYAEAVRWYKSAAGKGHAGAQNNLGYMYVKGQGVVQDYMRAHMWHNLGAAKGDSNAVKNRDIVAKQMTTQQIAEAQKLARECQARNFKNCD